MQTEVKNLKKNHLFSCSFNYVFYKRAYTKFKFNFYNTTYAWLMAIFLYDIISYTLLLLSKWILMEMFFFVKDNPNEWARKEMNFSRFSPQYNCISWMDNSAASQTLLLFPYSSASNISIEKYSRSLNNEELHTFMYFIYFSISFLQYLKYYTILLTLRLYVTIFKAELPNLFESITFFLVLTCNWRNILLFTLIPTRSQTFRFAPPQNAMALHKMYTFKFYELSPQSNTI